MEALITGIHEIIGREAVYYENEAFINLGIFIIDGGGKLLLCKR